MTFNELGERYADALADKVGLQFDNQRLRELLRRTEAELFIIDESAGIAGWHLNGDVSPWSESALPNLRDEITDVLQETE